MSHTVQSTGNPPYMVMMYRNSITSMEDDQLRSEQPGRLSYSERWWRKHQPWLEQSGYMLRPRFRPDCKFSWIAAKKDHSKVEDGQRNWNGVVIDATRISDGAAVILKKMEDGSGIDELAINSYLASEPLASDPRNHCAATSVVLQVPDDDEVKELIVMPRLRPFNNPRFETYGEWVAFLTQLFEGIQFMHEHHVVHGDCTENNIMYDPTSMYPNSYHPAKINRNVNFKGKAKHYSRTERPPKYYLIDFGLSRRYDPSHGLILEMPLSGGDKTAPEHADDSIPCDPFPTDIYYLGNLIRELFILKCTGFKFIESLVNDMTHKDPAKRPTIDEVVSRFKEIRASLSTWKLRSRIPRRSEIFPVRAVFFCIHTIRTARYIFAGHAAIPDP